MKTQQDIIALCAQRDLSPNCILKYAGTAAVEAPSERWKALSDAEKLQEVFDVIDQWSQEEARIDYLREEHDCWAWAGTRSHAIGMQLAEAIKSAGLFAERH